jgi:hypothetical protein
MKIQKLTCLFALMVFSSSCAMIAGNKNDTVSISSQPAGADIFIEGVNYGKTPATINIEAKKSKVSLVKEGYGSAELDLEIWVTAKDGPCKADMLTSIAVVPLYSLMWSGNCNEFKQENYSVIIPPSRLNNVNSNSSIGSRSSQQMMNYYGQQPSGINQVPNNNMYNRRR